MTYALVIPKNPFNETSLHVKDDFLTTQKLWSVNEGEMLLHYSDVNNAERFLREIGVNQLGERTRFYRYNEDELLAIFELFLQKNELLTVKFTSGFETEEQPEEIEAFHKLLRDARFNPDKDIQFLKDDLRYIMTELSGIPHDFTLVKNHFYYHIYPNSVIYTNATKPEQTVLAMYRSIFKALNRPFSLSEISLLPKEKVDHPLKEAQRVAQLLFDEAGEKVKNQLNLSDKTYQAIQQELLTHAEQYKNKKIYK